MYDTAYMIQCINNMLAVSFLPSLAAVTSLVKRAMTRHAASCW